MLYSDTKWDDLALGLIYYEKVLHNQIAIRLYCWLTQDDKWYDATSIAGDITV